MKFLSFLLFGLIVGAGLLVAGTLRVVTFPVVHPLKTTKAVASVATYPLRHPVKTIKAITPIQPRW